MTIQHLEISDKKFINSNQQTKFILATRDKKSWKKSISRMKAKKRILLKDLTEINVYYKEVTEFFKSNNRLLVIDLNKIDLKRIYSFLEIKNQIKIEYPKELI